MGNDKADKAGIKLVPVSHTITDDHFKAHVLHIRRSIEETEKAAQEFLQNAVALRGSLAGAIQAKAIQHSIMRPGDSGENVNLDYETWTITGLTPEDSEADLRKATTTPAPVPVVTVTDGVGTAISWSNGAPVDPEKDATLQ